MAARRRVVEFEMSEADRTALLAISRSRSEKACRVERARLRHSLPRTRSGGTLSLLAGIDLVSGKVHGLVADRHRSREFIVFLKQIDAAYPCSTAIKLIPGSGPGQALDNHSAHISRETRDWLAEQPEGRFEFIFTPKHGSWLNLIEGFF